MSLMAKQLFDGVELWEDLSETSDLISPWYSSPVFLDHM